MAEHNGQRESNRRKYPKPPAFGISSPKSLTYLKPRWPTSCMPGPQYLLRSYKPKTEIRTLPCRLEDINPYRHVTPKPLQSPLFSKAVVEHSNWVYHIKFLESSTQSLYENQRSKSDDPSSKVSILFPQPGIFFMRQDAISVQ
jgi:hypothetical protein